MEAQKILHGYGITAAADMGTSIEDWQTFRRAGDEGRLTLRIMAYALGPDAMTLLGGSGPTPWLYDDKLRMNGVKLYLDGALGSRGAWLKAPYSDDPGNTGLPLLTPSQFRNTLVRAGLGNFQVAVHAIGDAANAEALNAYAEVAESFKGDRRWRIEHAQIVDPADLAKFGKNGIVASMQPVHQDVRPADGRGPAGARAARRRLCLEIDPGDGCDARVRDPMRRWNGPIPSPGWQPQSRAPTKRASRSAVGAPEERITREQALAAYTTGAAYAGFAEKQFGRLAAGERADFLLVDRDPLLASPSDLRATRVIGTWVGGRQVYSAQ